MAYRRKKSLGKTEEVRTCEEKREETERKPEGKTKEKARRLGGKMRVK